MDDLLVRSALSQVLETRWLGRHFHIYSSIDSTNTALKTMASQGEPTGTMVLTDHQSSGRGRLGRQWHAPAGSSLLFSLLFRPAWSGERAQWLMMIASLSALEAIRIETGLDLRIKWPNDIVSGGQPPWRKCGGILLESDFQDSVLRSAVVGIGINLNIAESQLEKNTFSATSLQVETGRTVPRLPLLARLLRIMEEKYEAISAGYSPIGQWKNRLVNIGQSVRVEVPGTGKLIEGVAVDTDEMGRLLVRDHSGKMHEITAADVTLRS
jgi:BirA family biotin operon repressor/biotin-[acetyl-CoA-carboxylase] ligase